MNYWELIKIKGIHVRVHPIGMVSFFYFCLIFQRQLFDSSEVEISFITSFGLGLFTSFLVFLSGMLHELGHSFVALNEGVKVSSITSYYLVGFCEYEKDCLKPIGSLKVALAGPATSIFLAVIIFFFSNTFLLTSSVFYMSLFLIMQINIVIGLFNLLPVLPLDGGIILKSIIWIYTGNRNKALTLSIKIGRLLSVFGLFLGLFYCFSGSAYFGFWLIILGWIGFVASRSQTQMMNLRNLLCYTKVGDSTSRQYRVLEDNLPIRKLSEANSKSHEGKICSPWVLLCRSGRWVGYLDEKPIKEIPVQDWDKYCLSDFSKPLQELPSISEKSPLWEAVIALEKSKEGRLLVRNLAGLPSGTLERVDIGKLVLELLGLRVSKEVLLLARKRNLYPLGLALPKIVDSMISQGLED